MKETGPGAEILKSYNEIPRQPAKVKSDGAKKDETPVIYDLREFIHTYITSLANVIKVFPNDNLDINALEAHYWDRLRYFNKYDSFKEVRIKNKEEIEFINKAISAIEDWFYGGAWTSCLATPTDQEIKDLLSHNRNTFLKRVRKETNSDMPPNLGRDTKYPLPNIYEDVAAGINPRQVYLGHAFKFFHGPAAVLNTLTKISTQQEIRANKIRFEEFIKLLMLRSVPEKFQQWGYPPGNPNREMVTASL